MDRRHDALAAAAQMVLAVESIGRATVQMVATVGHLAVLPDATNVIPGVCTFTLDLRAPGDARRLAGAAKIFVTIYAIADARGVHLRIAKPTPHKL